MDLVKSKVAFDELTHTYWLHGKELSGVTAMLSRQLFFDKYDNIPAHILAEAAAKGTAIHKDIAENNVTNYEEVENFYTLVRKHDLQIEDHEYLISDNKDFASMIDVVFRDNEREFSLADIKTTYTLDRNYVSWQLSVYAYLFEMQNRGAKINKLYAIWLRGDKAEIVEVYRQDNTVIKELLLSDLKGDCYRSNTLPIPMPDRYVAMCNQLTTMAELVAEFTQKEKELKEYLVKQMQERGLQNIEIGNMKVSYKAPYTATRLDTKTLKQVIPNIDDYMIHSAVKGSVNIKYN